MVINWHSGLIFILYCIYLQKIKQLKAFQVINTFQRKTDLTWKFPEKYLRFLIFVLFVICISESESFHKCCNQTWHCSCCTSYRCEAKVHPLLNQECDNLLLNTMKHNVHIYKCVPDNHFSRALSWCLFRCSWYIDSNDSMFMSYRIIRRYIAYGL